MFSVAPQLSPKENQMKEYAVIDPVTNEVVESYGHSSDADIQLALASAESAYRTFSKKTTVAERAKMMARVAELHNERADELGRIIVQEMGKPLSQAVGEVEFSAAIYQYYADNAEEFLKDEVIDNPDGGKAFIRRQGVGVLLGIMPWNFPFYQVARFAGPYVIAGNTVILKHAEQCPKSASAIAGIFREAGFPDGAFVNVFATHDQISTIIADPRVQGVSLTGSERAGAIVAEQAGRHLKKVVLELGGSDVCLVLDTADIDAAVDIAVAGRLENSGQACNGSKRIVVMDKYYDEFAEKFVAKMGALTMGPGIDDPDLGPLSSRKSADVLSSQVSGAVAQGATLHVGAEIADGCYFPPTVLSNVTPEMAVYREELFGPVAVLYRVSSDEEAIELANSSPYGLGSIVVCDDTERAERVGDALEVGMVFINGVGLDAPHLSFGGVKRSGFGRELGRLGMEEFVNKKIFVHGS
jgi:succinate-semialdehyde dehydrogenase/glutarate-semialdehyde dehydrogenase